MAEMLKGLLCYSLVCSHGSGTPKEHEKCLLLLMIGREHVWLMIYICCGACVESVFVPGVAGCQSEELAPCNACCFD